MQATLTLMWNYLISMKVSNPTASKPIRQDASLLQCNMSKCNRRFKHLKNLYNHQKNCGKTEIKCSSCQITFKHVKYLKKHIKVCHNQSTFQCTYDKCDYKLQSAAKLKSHLKSHHKVTCSSCGKTFKNAKTMKSHKYKAHSKKKVGEDNHNPV